MSLETVIGILATALISETMFGIAWIVKVTKIETELRLVKETLGRIEQKVHDSPCAASLTLRGDMGIQSERIKSVEARVESKSA